MFLGHKCTGISTRYTGGGHVEGTWHGGDHDTPCAACERDTIDCRSMGHLWWTITAPLAIHPYRDVISTFFRGGGQYICWDIRECLYHVGMHAHTHACVQYCAPYNRSMNYVFTLKHPQNISNKMYCSLQSKEKIAHFIIEIVNNPNVTNSLFVYVEEMLKN